MKPQTNAVDRRTEPRQPIDVPIGYRCQVFDEPASTLRSGWADVVDVSERGLGLADLDLDLPEGAPIDLLLFIEDEAVLIEGRIAWSDGHDRSHRVGIAIDDEVPHLVSRLVFLRGRISGEITPLEA